MEGDLFNDTPKQNGTNEDGQLLDFGFTVNTSSDNFNPCSPKSPEQNGITGDLLGDILSTVNSKPEDIATEDNGTESYDPLCQDSSFPVINSSVKDYQDNAEYQEEYQEDFRQNFGDNLINTESNQIEIQSEVLIPEVEVSENELTDNQKRFDAAAVQEFEDFAATALFEGRSDEQENFPEAQNIISTESQEQEIDSHSTVIEATNTVTYSEERQYHNEEPICFKPAQIKAESEAEIAVCHKPVLVYKEEEPAEPFHTEDSGVLVYQEEEVESPKLDMPILKQNTSLTTHTTKVTTTTTVKTITSTADIKTEEVTQDVSASAVQHAEPPPAQVIEQKPAEPEPTPAQPSDEEVSSSLVKNGHLNETEPDNKHKIKKFVMEEQDYDPPKGLTRDQGKGQLEERASPVAMNIQSTDDDNNENTCAKCNTRVYVMEKIVADKQTYHKTCFKCTKCRRTLDLGTYSVNEGNLYCKPHFMELFRLRGHYEDRFKGQRELSPNTVVPVNSAGGINEGETVKAEDKNEDGIESVPNLRNIRSMFEGSEGQSGAPPVPAQKERKPLQIKSRWGYDRGDTPSPPRDPNITRETKEKEDPNSIDFGGLQSVKAKYQQSVTSSESVAPKKSFVLQQDLATDQQQLQPAPSPPRDPTIIMCDQWVEEDMPPAELTSSLVARFKQMESEVGVKTPPLPVSKKAGPSPHVVHDKLVKQPGRSGPPPPRTDLLQEEGQIAEYNTQNAPQGGISENKPEVRADVIRESDRMDGGEMPESGMAKNRLAMFKQMESATPNSPPSPGSRRRQPINIKQVNGNGASTDAGIVENQPERKVDVVRETDELEDVKPPPATAKKLLAVFQNLEAEGEANKRNNQVVQRKPSSFKTSPVNPALVKNQSKMKEFTPPRDTETNQHFETSEQSVRNPDTIICDQIYDETPELPVENTTKNLVARFKEIQTKAKEDVDKSKLSDYVPVRRTLGEWGRSSPTPPPNGNHCEQEVDAGEFSNTPEYNENVYRESDRNDELEFPNQGTTKNMRARFQQS